MTTMENSSRINLKFWAESCSLVMTSEVTLNPSNVFKKSSILRLLCENNKHNMITNPAATATTTNSQHATASMFNLCLTRHT